MSTKANCPHCQCVIRIPSDFGGRSVKCPQCLQRFLVPIAAVPVALPETPPALSRAPVPNFEALVQEALADESAPVVEAVCARCGTKQSGPADQLPGQPCSHCQAPLPRE